MAHGGSAGLVVLALLGAAAAPAPPVTRTVRYTPADRASGRYQYVPFDVPAGTARLTVAYRYDRAEGANVVDLGLYEPGPLDLGTPAFRGWSGGARDTVTIDASSATPGYWPGPIPPGRWHVGLGLYKVAPAGVEVAIDVTAEPGPAARPAPLPSLPPAPKDRGPGWYSGALHAHTVHSDGSVSAVELSRLARAAGLDFLAITDHNNTAHQVEALPDDGLLRIVGEEITTPGGHFNAWGLPRGRGQVDFRVLPGDPRIADLVRTAIARGALVSVNHPRDTCAGCSWEHAVPDGVVAMEVTNGDPVASLAVWDGLLREGRRITGVGTSDWHRGPNPIDRASVRVWAERLDERAVLDGLRAGRVVVMADGRTPPPEMTVTAGGARARPGDTLRRAPGDPVSVEVVLPPALGAARVDLVVDGAVVASRSEPRAVFAHAGPARTVRVHVFGADGMPLAIVNPVYLEPVSAAP